MEEIKLVVGIRGVSVTYEPGWRRLSPGEVPREAAAIILDLSN